MTQNADSGRIITPRQLEDGYYERVGFFVKQKRFVVIRRLEDGNYLVREPLAQNADSRTPGSIPGGVGAAPKGSVVQSEGVGFPQARTSPPDADSVDQCPGSGEPCDMDLRPGQELYRCQVCGEVVISIKDRSLQLAVPHNAKSEPPL